MSAIAAFLISKPNDFSYFWSTSHPDASYQVSSQLAFRFRRRSKNRFSRRLPWRLSWFSYQKDFSYFWPTSHPDASYQVSSQVAFQFRRRSKKIDFQDSGHPDASYQVSSPIGTILATFDLQVTPPRCFLTSFESIGILVQEKKQKIDL